MQINTMTTKLTPGLLEWHRFATLEVRPSAQPPTKGDRMRVRWGRTSASLAVVALAFVVACSPLQAAGQVSTLTLKSKTILDAPRQQIELDDAPDRLPQSGALYQKPTGIEMIKYGGYSSDNGRTWETMEASPDFDSNLPYGYRRTTKWSAPWLDPVNGNILVLVNCMDASGKNPNAIEPSWAWRSYYLRYRVSTDGGRTYLFDEPIVQKGKEYSPKHPVDGVHIGKNSFCLGDRGCRPIRTREGTVLVPMQRPPLKPDGEHLYNPGGGSYWLDSMILIGHWTEDNHIAWDASEPIEGDDDRTSQGLYEPTLAQMPDGKILCVMRGSNGGPRDPSYAWPSRRWASFSADGGHTWSEPKPLAYSDGKPFFSPASMSRLFTHSSGRIYWIGNLRESNCRGFKPRWPLVIGEVDPETHGLIRESVLVIDTKQPDEKKAPYLSHLHSFEDRETGDIVLTMRRTRRPALYVIGVESSR